MTLYVYKYEHIFLGPFARVHYSAGRMGCSALQKGLGDPGIVDTRFNESSLHAYCVSTGDIYRVLRKQRRRC